VEKQKTKINSISKGKLTIWEKDIDRLLVKNLKSERLQFKLLANSCCIENSDIIMLGHVGVSKRVAEIMLND
jgi:UDP-glucose 6-dehydrogenase